MLERKETWDHRGRTVRQRVGLLTIERVEAEIAVANWLIRTMETFARYGRFDPVSVRICKDVERTAKLQAALLASTGVRYSEMIQLDLVRLVEGGVQEVHMPKTGRTRYVSLDYGKMDVDPAPWAEKATVNRLSYNALSLALSRAIPFSIKKHLDRSHHNTHVFRHLSASWMSAQGASVKEIAGWLGHSSEQAALSYLHEGLFRDYIPQSGGYA